MSGRVAACGCIHRDDGSVVVWCKRHAGEPVGVTIVGNYVSPDGSPIIATRLPDSADKNVIGGVATARAWTSRWITACADVTVFSSGDSLMWDHGRTRHQADPGDWIVWTGAAYRLVPAEDFAGDYSAVDMPHDPEPTP